MPDATSLNQLATAGDAGSSEIGELIQDERASDAPAEVMADLETEQLGTALEHVPEPARHVLVRRYGLDGEDRATLKELGEELDLSRERIRQLQRKAELEIKCGRYGGLLRDASAS
jgi:RNA polymerase primary sigma factor